MDIPSLDYQPIIITLQLATVTVLVLLVIGIPISWWLAHTRTRFRPVFEAIVALPLVYLLRYSGFIYLSFLVPMDGSENLLKQYLAPLFRSPLRAL